MPKGQSDLAWTNINRGDMEANGAENVWDAFLKAKADLEEACQVIARESGQAEEGDAFKFSYARIGQGSIGMAIDKPAKGQRSGFAGLQRPQDQRKVEAEKLAEWQQRQREGGRRF